MHLKVNLIFESSFNDYSAGLRQGLSSCGLGLDTTVLSNGSFPDDLAAVQGERLVTQLRPRVSSLRSLGFLGKFRRILGNPDCDVVHLEGTSNPWTDLVAAYLRPRSRPLVVTIHDLDPHPGDTGTFAAAFWGLKTLARRSDALIVHAEHLRHRAIELGVNADRVHVVPHGELASVMGPAPAPASATRGQEVLFFGRAHSYKGLEVLLKAMPLVVQQVPDASVVIAGAGAEIDRLFPPGVDLPPYVQVLNGYQSKPDVATLFGRCDVVALPYIEASQSGVAAVAIGYGKSVVASRVGGLPEIVRDRRNGLLVEPDNPESLAEALVEVLTNGALRRSFEVEAERLAVNELSWAAIGATTAAIYDDLLRSER